MRDTLRSCCWLITRDVSPTPTPHASRLTPHPGADPARVDGAVWLVDPCGWAGLPDSWAALGNGTKPSTRGQIRAFFDAMSSHSQQLFSTINSFFSLSAHSSQKQYPKTPFHGQLRRETQDVAGCGPRNAHRDISVPCSHHLVQPDCWPAALPSRVWHRHITCIVVCRLCPSSVPSVVDTRGVKGGELLSKRGSFSRCGPAEPADGAFCRSRPGTPLLEAVPWAANCGNCRGWSWNHGPWKLPNSDSLVLTSEHYQNTTSFLSVSPRPEIHDP